MLGLQHIKVFGSADSEADVALKVSRLIVVAFFTRSVLWKVLGGSHDELSLVGRISHVLRLDCLIKISVRAGQVNQRLVV